MTTHCVFASIAALALAVPASPIWYTGDRIRVLVPASQCDVTTAPYNAVCDGRTDTTSAIQAAINDCAKSGGTTVIPSGAACMSFGLSVPKTQQYAFRIDGTLIFINDTARWPPADAHCLTFLGGSFITLLGYGKVDGQGAAWWPTPAAFRPGLVQVNGVDNFLVRDLLFVNSPNHQLEIFANDVELVNVTVLAPPSTNVPYPSHNTDAVDVHGSPFWVHNCTFNTGDDNAAIHASDVLIEDCNFGTGHGASIGSLGGAVALSNITVRRIAFDGTTTVIRIKSDAGASGYLTNVTYADCTAKDVGETIQVNMFYTITNKGAAAPPTTLVISNIVISNITSVDATTAGDLTCDANSPCVNFTIIDVVHTGKAKPKPWACKAAHGIASGNVPDVCLVP